MGDRAEGPTGRRAYEENGKGAGGTNARVFMNKKIKLVEIVTDAGTQVRAGLNESTVSDYAEALAAGAKFPPVIVFHDGSRHVAADGFHRIAAAGRRGATEIECEVRVGGKAEALKFALGCNAHHGLRRTNADKRHAVGLALREFPGVSDRALAEMCLVGHPLVAEVRASTGSSSSCPPPTRLGLDCRERKLPPPPMQRSAGPAPSGAVALPVKSPPPPPPSQVLDGTGWPIPTQLIPLWQRTAEVQEMLTTLSRVKGALRTAQDSRDKLFLEVNFSSALSQLDQAWVDVKSAKPFAVCPTCQGQVPDQCTLCRGRGMISEHRWNTCVTREDKEFRAKSAGGRREVGR